MSDIQGAKDFVRMANEDTIAAQCTSVPYSIFFHAQQAAEKYLKAFLAFHGRLIPKTHDLKRLVESCTEIDPAFAAFLTNTNSLSLFAVEIRYRPSKEEADARCPEAWSAMLSIMGAVREQLTEEVLTPG